MFWFVSDFGLGNSDFNSRRLGAGKGFVAVVLLKSVKIKDPWPNVTLA